MEVNVLYVVRDKDRFVQVCTGGKATIEVNGMMVFLRNKDDIKFVLEQLKEGLKKVEVEGEEANE